MRRQELIEIARQRRIPAPIGKVWDVIADASRLPDWYGRVERVEVLAGEGIGRRQRITAHWRGQESVIEQVVTVFEPQRRLEWRHVSERLGGQPAPRFAAETVLIMDLESETPDTTLMTLTSRQLPVDPDKEAAMRGNADYLAQMFEASLVRLDQVLFHS